MHQAYLCFIVGAILVAIGLSSFKKAADKKRACTSSVQGVVTNVEKSRYSKTDKDGNETEKSHYTPTYSYTVDGNVFTLKGASSGYIGHYKEGDVTDVYYDPKNPSYAYVKGTASKPGAIIFTLLGIAVIVLGFLVE